MRAGSNPRNTTRSATTTPAAISQLPSLVVLGDFSISSFPFEVLRAGMVEHERRDRRLGVHHEALGEADADLLRAQETPERCLVREIRTGGIAERDADAAIPRLQLLGDRQV